jgi:hypothetical protein
LPLNPETKGKTMSDERKLIESARDKFREGERLIASGLDDVVSVMRLNEKGGEAIRANAAGLARGLIMRPLADMYIAHAKSTDLLFEHWPEYGAEVMLKGPGRK